MGGGTGTGMPEGMSVREYMDKYAKPYLEQKKGERELDGKNTNGENYSEVYIAAVTDMHATPDTDRDFRFLIHKNGERRWVIPLYLNDLLKENGVNEPGELVGQIVKSLKYSVFQAAISRFYREPRIKRGVSYNKEAHASPFNIDRRPLHFVNEDRQVLPNFEDVTDELASRIEAEGWDLDDTD